MEALCITLHQRSKPSSDSSRVKQKPVWMRSPPPRRGRAGLAIRGRAGDNAGAVPAPQGAKTMTDEREGTADELARSYGEVLAQPWADLPDGDAAAAPGPAEGSSPPPLSRIVEALLFVGGPPLTAVRACEAVRGLTPTAFAQVLEGLNRDYRRQSRPYRIQPRDQGFELALRPRFRGVLDRLYGSLARGPAVADRPGRAGPGGLSAARRQERDRQFARRRIRGRLTAAGAARPGRGAARRRRPARSGLPHHAALPERFHLRSLEDLPRTQELHRL